jgi:hypothetical protein
MAKIIKGDEVIVLAESNSALTPTTSWSTASMLQRRLLSRTR